MKKLVSLLLVFMMSLSLICTVSAASPEAKQAADALHDLGLFQGVGTNADGTPNYDLDRAPNRMEAVTMLVRLLGKEDEAKAGTWNTPFTDVAGWAKPYVGYAYANKLTNGISATKFGGTDLVTASQYITFVLRALGYDSSTDFKWNAAWELSDKLGITNGQYNASSSFTRGDVAIISYNALSAKMNTIGNWSFTLGDLLGLSLPSENTPENTEQSTGNQQASADASAYIYTVAHDFGVVKSKYSSATPVKGYVCTYTDIKGHQCVLTVVVYEIIDTYYYTVLRDLTTGETIKEPMDYYEHMADRSWGQTSLDYLQQAIDAGGHYANMLLGKEGIQVGPDQMVYP